jgi:hypothetical protein
VDNDILVSWVRDVTIKNISLRKVQTGRCETLVTKYVYVVEFSDGNSVEIPYNGNV